MILSALDTIDRPDRLYLSPLGAAHEGNRIAMLETQNQDTTLTTAKTATERRIVKASQNAIDDRKELNAWRRALKAPGASWMHSGIVALAPVR